MIAASRNLVKRLSICNAPELRVNSIYSNTNCKNVFNTVAEWSERIAFGSQDSELAANIQARFTLPDRSRSIKVI